MVMVITARGSVYFDGVFRPYFGRVFPSFHGIFSHMTFGLCQITVEQKAAETILLSYSSIDSDQK